MSLQIITSDVIAKVSKLAKIFVPPEKTEIFAGQLESILEHFNSLNKIDVTNVTPTYQVTGLKTVLRDDVIDTKRMFTQAQALSNTKQQHEGYFVTKATISKK